MIDRSSRDQMAKAIRTYMSEEISAFQFDEALTEATLTTKDSTAVQIRETFWLFYDDFTDHKIVATKEEWDLFNRLLLLLESDAEIETVNASRRWHPMQAVAAGFLILFLIVAIPTGWGEHLWAYAFPFGPVSMVIAWLNSRRNRKQITTATSALTPFPSFGSLFALRRQMTGFVRTRYPKPVEKRNVRGPFTARLMWIQWGILWCLFSPVALFLQTLPERQSETRIVMPGQSGESSSPRSQP